MVAVGAVLIVILGAGGVMLLYRGYRQNQGLAALHEGIRLLQDGKAGEAVPQLEQAGHALPRGEARLLALFFLAQARAAQQQKDAENKVYEALIAQAGKEHYLKQFALIQLGRDAEQKQEFSRARQFYERAAAMSGPQQGLALLAAARVRQRLGQDEAAREAYAKFLADRPDSPLADVVQQQEVE
jgi:tetratricopeptide (TPR) repeat protein